MEEETPAVERNEEIIAFNTVKTTISEKVQSIINDFLSNKTYSANEGPAWAHHISEEVTKFVHGLNKSFKYSVSTMILDKRDGGGFHMSSSCYWNTQTDGNSVDKWENDTLICIVNTFGFFI